MSSLNIGDFDLQYGDSVMLTIDTMWLVLFTAIATFINSMTCSSCQKINRQQNKTPKHLNILPIYRWRN